MASASEKSIWTETFTADEALTDYQYHGVRMSDDRKCELMDNVTYKPVGVLLNEPGDEEEALVCVIGRSPVVLGDTMSAGEYVRFDSSGHAIPWDAGTDTTMYSAGMITIGGVSGEVGEMLVGVCPPRGAC